MTISICPPAEPPERHTDLDLPGHAVAVLFPAALLHQVVLLERALERVLQVRDLELARVEAGVVLRALAVRVVQDRDAVADRVREARRLGRQLRQLLTGCRLGHVVGRGEPPRVELRNVVDVLLQLLDLVLDRLDLRGGETVARQLLIRPRADVARLTSAKKGPRSGPIRLWAPAPFMGCMVYASPPP